jgi:hypothetical protein
MMNDIDHDARESTSYLPFDANSEEPGIASVEEAGRTLSLNRGAALTGSRSAWSDLGSNTWDDTQYASAPSANSGSQWNTATYAVAPGNEPTYADANSTVSKSGTWNSNQYAVGSQKPREGDYMSIVDEPKLSAGGNWDHNQYAVSSQSSNSQGAWDANQYAVGRQADDGTET